MKPFLLCLFFVLITSLCARAQSSREVDGTVTDSAKLSLKGATIKLVSGKGDSSVIVTDSTGKFAFPVVKSNKFILTVSSPGYQIFERNFDLDTISKVSVLDPIILTKSRSVIAPAVAPIAITTRTGREVDGTVTDSAKLSIRGAIVKLRSDQDSITVVSDTTGKFVLSAVKSNKFTLSCSTDAPQFSTAVRYQTMGLFSDPLSL